MSKTKKVKICFNQAICCTPIHRSILRIYPPCVSLKAINLLTREESMSQAVKARNWMRIGSKIDCSITKINNSWWMKVVFKARTNKIGYYQSKILHLKWTQLTIMRYPWCQTPSLFRPKSGSTIRTKSERQKSLNQTNSRHLTPHSAVIHQLKWALYQDLQAKQNQEEASWVKTGFWITLLWKILRIKNCTITTCREALKVQRCDHRIKAGAHLPVHCPRPPIWQENKQISSFQTSLVGHQIASHHTSQASNTCKTHRVGEDLLWTCRGNLAIFQALQQVKFALFTTQRGEGAIIDQIASSTLWGDAVIDPRTLTLTESAAISKKFSLTWATTLHRRQQPC